MNGYRFDRLKVLVVDDNPHMRRLVSTILHAFGIVQIVEAPEADTAWKMLREQNPDVAIVDWMMEGMTGLDLTKMIRTSTATPNPFIPVIMLTGYTNVERVQQARDAGVNEFLAKPVSVTAILTRLTSVIEHPRPFVRTKVYFGPCRRRHGQEDYKGTERRGVVTAETEAAE
jgi:two-component system chemotaxis response regulator CheY